MRPRPWFVASLALGLLTLGLGSPARGEDEEPGAEPAPEGGEKGGEPAPAGGEEGGEGAQGAAGRTRTFEQINVSWTLPAAAQAPEPAPEAAPQEGGESEEGKGAGGPVVWQWGTEGNASLQKQERGLVASAGLVQDGKVLMQMELAIQPARPGSSLGGFVDNQDNVDNLGRNFDSPPAPHVDRDVPVGNWKGGAISMTGRGRNGRPLHLRLYIVILKAVIYEVHVTAHENAQRDHNKALLAALAGIKFLATDEGVRGPIASPFLAHTEPRGKGGPEEKLDRGSVKLKRPASFTTLDTGGVHAEYAGLETWPYAAEARKPGAYAFVGVRRIRMPKTGAEGQPPALEDVVDKLETAWSNDVSDAVTRPKGKSNRSPGTFKGAKGFDYEFRGNAHGVPWVEKGWVVKDAGAIWVVRMQLGGKDAESLLGSDANSLVKSLVFEK